MPYEFYSVVVRAFRSTALGPASPSSDFRTPEAPPSAPLNVDFPLFRLSPFSITVAWMPPQRWNGVPQGFELIVTQEGVHDRIAWTVTSAVAESHEVDGLVPFTPYTFSLRALSGGGYGPFANHTETTLRYIPGGVVLDVAPTGSHPDSIAVWASPPAMPNGDLSVIVFRFRRLDRILSDCPGSFPVSHVSASS